MPDNGAARARRELPRGEAESSVTEIFDAIFDDLPPGVDAASSPTLDTEFVYYATKLRTLAPALSSAGDRKAASRWVRKLYGPEYHCDMFKEKRNRYMVGLTLSLMDGEMSGIFAKPPPTGALVDVSKWTKPPTPAPAWESDTMWSETADNLQEHIFSYACSVHKRGEACPPGSRVLHTLLDDTFKYLLYLARPYVARLPCSSDRNLMATWLQALCAVKRDACVEMKGVRNDYIQTLLGYVSELRVAGPFVDYPFNSRLVPLGEAAKVAARRHPITDPTAREADDFLREQPQLESGAFCFVAVTGRAEGREQFTRGRSHDGDDAPCDPGRRSLLHARVSSILAKHGIDEGLGRPVRGLSRGSSSRISVTIPRRVR